MSVVDAPSAVRAGDEIESAALTAFLDGILDLGDDLVEVAQYPSGFSNLTYAVEVGTRRMVLRCPPRGTKAATAHDMLREAEVLRRVRPHFPLVPEVLAVCEDPGVIGAPFFLMERLEGVILRRDLPAGLELSPAKARELGLRVATLQAELHDLDAAELEDLGKPEGYLTRQVEGWTRRYRAARTEDVPDLADVEAWLVAGKPADDPRPSLVHNDFKLDNLVLDPGDPARVLGVLDWELATRGDALLDLGNSLAYWVEAGDHPETDAYRTMPTHLPGMPTRAELVATYLAARGLPPGRDLTWYYVFGLYRLAGIAQQIYYRFFHGQTTNPRFGVLGHAVRALGGTARRVIAGDPW